MPTYRIPALPHTQSPHPHLYALLPHCPPPRTKITNDYWPHPQLRPMPRRMASFTIILPQQNLPPFNRYIDLAHHPYSTTTSHTIQTSILRIPTRIERIPIHTNTKLHTHTPTNTNVARATIMFHSHARQIHFPNHMIPKSFSAQSHSPPWNLLNNALHTHNYDTAIPLGIILPPEQPHRILPIVLKRIIRQQPFTWQTHENTHEVSSQTRLP